MRTTRSLRMGFTLAVTGIVCSSAHAQSIWLPPATHSQIQLEAQKAIYNPSDGVAFLTTAWYLSAWARLSPGVSLYAELPYSNYSEEGFEGQSIIGNPYLGIVTGSSDLKGWVFEAGGRPPVVGEVEFDNAAAILNGWLTDVSRLDAFAAKTAAVKLRTGGYVVSNPEAGMFVKVMAGVHGWIYTSEDLDGDLFADLDVALWHSDERANVGAILSGRSLLSEARGSFMETSEFQLGLSGSMRFGQVEPGIHAHLPLGNEGFIRLGELVDVVLGVHCTVHLSK